MCGESQAEARLGFHGLSGDWRFAFIQTANTSVFPWLMGCQFPGSVRTTPSFIDPSEDPSEPHKSAVRVRIPDGEGLPLKGELLRKHLEQDNQRTIHLLRLDFNRTYDIADVSLVTTGTLNGLSSLVGRPLESLAFRPNILIETFPQPGAEADATSDAEPLGGKRRAGDGGAALSPVSTT